MNNDCFAYKNKRCKALDKMLCADGNCSFYKTANEEKTSLKKTYERIASLDKATQKYISNTYYKGRFPWLKAGDAYEC